jgi:hypothetical protein
VRPAPHEARLPDGIPDWPEDRRLSRSCCPRVLMRTSDVGARPVPAGGLVVASIRDARSRPEGWALLVRAEKYRSLWRNSRSSTPTTASSNSGRSESAGAKREYCPARGADGPARPRDRRGRDALPSGRVTTDYRWGRTGASCGRPGYMPASSEQGVRSPTKDGSRSLPRRVDRPRQPAEASGGWSVKCRVVGRSATTRAISRRVARRLPCAHRRSAQGRGRFLICSPGDTGTTRRWPAASIRRRGVRKARTGISTTYRDAKNADI